MMIVGQNISRTEQDLKEKIADDTQPGRVNPFTESNPSPSQFRARVKRPSHVKKRRN